MKKILTVVIADDNEKEVNILASIIEAHPNFKVVNTCSNEEELVNSIIKHRPSLILLDTIMPGGIEAIQNIQSIMNDINFIIISNLDQACTINTFARSALDFIVKPIKENGVLVALEKAFQFITCYSDRGQEKKLAVTYRGAVFFVKIKDILFIERADRKTLFHTTERIVESSDTLENIADKLLGEIFIQTHRSYIINVNHISYLTRSGNTFLIYFDQYEKPAFISKQRINDVKHYIMSLFE